MCDIASQPKWVASGPAVRILEPMMSRGGHFSSAARTRAAFAAAGTFALHAAIAALLLSSFTDLRQTSASPLITELELLDLHDEKAGEMSDPQPGAPACAPDKIYRGIGMQFDLDQMVIVAPETYPAYLAGIRVGDRILNPDFEPDDRGFDTVSVQRHKHRFQLTIKTQRICLR